MNISHHPIQRTLIFGFFCGLCFIPLSTGLSFLMPWSKVFGTITGWYIVLYSILLCRWSGVRMGSIAFPVLLTFGTIFLVESPTAYFLITLAVLSWIRSSLCFQASLKRFFIEIALSFGGGALVAGFVPGSRLTWALGIWMFFLVQALYFVFFETHSARGKRDPVIDPFEKSRKLAEEILS